MTILPVLDLRNNVVVRGVAGMRDQYRPVQSRLTPSCEPPAVARAIRDRLGLNEFYVADLDAILDGRPNVATYRELASDGAILVIDAGIRTAADAAPIVQTGAAAIVAGLETLSDPDVLAALCDEFGPERVIFSLDLSHGRPLGNAPAWGTDDPAALARRAVESGIRRMIVLDLAAVGIGRGVPTLPLCRRLLDELPGLRLIAGGGVRGPADLRELATAGVDQVLVASALHDGTIGPQEIAACR